MWPAVQAVMAPLRPQMPSQNGVGPTSCCGRMRAYMKQASTRAVAPPVVLAVGNEHGLCCLIELGIGRNWSIPIFSASKLLTGYVFSRLAQEGRLTLQTRVAELLSWWDAKGGGCHNTTVWHLLTQSGSMDRFPGGLGQCRASTLLGCAREAYSHSCSRRPPGSGFEYAETNWYVLGAISLAVTGLPTYDDVFRRYLAGPLGMSNSCRFDLPSTQLADPGGGGRCSVLDYARFLRAAFADEIAPAAWRQQAERPQTKRLGIGTGDYWWPWHYGVGQWRECPPPAGRRRNGTNATFGMGRLLLAADSCEDWDARGVKVSSIGVAGYYPWILRRGRQSHWGILARISYVRPMEVSFSMGREVLPMAAEAVARLAPLPAPSAQQPLPPGDGGDLARLSQGLLAEQRAPASVAFAACAALCLGAAVLRGLYHLAARCRRPRTGSAPVGGAPAQKIGEAATEEEQEELLAIA